MPIHRYEIEPGVLGTLAGGFEHGPFYQQDFCVRVEVDADELRQAAEAIARASDRIMHLTEFGREIASIEEVEEWAEVVYTPNWASGPLFVDGQVELFTDWKGEISEVAANACLAVVVQELQASGVQRARIGRDLDRSHPRVFTRPGPAGTCIDPDRGRALGRAVAMPGHGYEIAAELGNTPVEQPSIAWSNICYRVEADDRDLRAAVEAMERVRIRACAVSEFGRELGSAEADEAEKIDIHTPVRCGTPGFVNSGVETSDHSWQPPVVADACLAIVVQELLAAGVPAATIGLTTSQQQARTRTPLR
jgi:hypothetical protein